MSEQLGIGAFARATGLSVSAVRFYGDRGVLVPADVDPTTGYRSYDSAQVPDAILLRDLRRLGMGLGDVTTYLSAPAAARQELLDRHLAGLERQLHDARSIARALDDHLARQEPPVNPITVTAAGLLDALDQILPAAGTDPEQPVLTCVLVEARAGSLRLVATDQFRLAIRDLPALVASDTSFRAVLPADTLRRWRTELTPDGEVTVGLADDHVVVRSNGRELRHRAVAAEFPAYEAILDRGDGRAGEVAAVVVDRARLLDSLERLTGDEGAVLLHARSGELHLLRRSDHDRLPARYDGPDADVAIDPAFAIDAVTAAIGPEVVIELEISEPFRPVIFRSADDGTYTTMLMPVRLPA